MYLFVVFVFMFLLITTGTAQGEGLEGFSPPVLTGKK